MSVPSHPSPSPLSPFLHPSPSVGDTLEKSRESRLHQLRHNVTQDFEWAVSSPLSSLATAEALCRAFLRFATHRRVRAGIDLCPRVKTRGLSLSRRGLHVRTRDTLLMVFLLLQSGKITQTRRAHECPVFLRSQHPPGWWGGEGGQAVPRNDEPRVNSEQINRISALIYRAGHRRGGEKKKRSRSLNAERMPYTRGPGGC